jgi:membrane protease YdiL (CAAX protease family)
LSDNFRQYWFSENFYNLLISGIITVGIFILLIFRYKFSKADNFQINRSTLIIGILCLLVSIAVIAYSCSAGEQPLEAYFGETLKLLIGVSLFEELIFRGFITNELFRLKEKGLNIQFGILISAVLFGLTHLPAYIVYNNWTVGGAIFQFVFPTIIGLAYAIILYYKKDIVSLIFIHTASNICGSMAGQPFDIVFFIIMCLYAISLIPVVRKNALRFAKTIDENKFSVPLLSPIPVCNTSVSERC